MAKVDTYQHPELGQALRFLRARSGLSQARVAEAVSARGGRMTPVWLSRIESAPDRGGGPYPSVTLLDRILAVLGSSRAELEYLLRECPWGRVGEGAEWGDDVWARGSAAAPVAAGGGASSPAAAAAPSPAGAPMSVAVPPGVAARARGSSPAHASPPDLAAEAAELGARYARLSRADQLALLARARGLS